jgi:hypothetical protein
MTDTARPESIAGGCLCGAVRFVVVFPNESDWPPLTVGAPPQNNQQVLTERLEWHMPVHNVSKAFGITVAAK